jgi:hypothetical protein
MKELIIILSTVIITSFWNKYIDPMCPKKNIMISGIKKTFRFIMKYALLIFLLVYVFWKMELNKFFIFNVVFVSFIILFRIFNDIIYNFKTDFIERQTSNLKKENKDLNKIKRNLKKR